MKLLFAITRGDDVGGAQVHIRDLATRLVREGHLVRVITGGQGVYTEALEKAGLQALHTPHLKHRISPVHDFRAYGFLRRAVREFEPDLVSLHSSKAGILGRLACATEKTPCIFTAHNWSFSDGIPEPGRSVYQRLERRMAPLARQIVCVSDYVLRLGIRAGIDPARLTRVHNGMPDTPLRARPGEGYPVRIVMVARFAEPKDHLGLLEAFREIPGAELLLVGDGPNRAAIQQAAMEKGVADRVRFLGYETRVDQVLADAHIFTLVSKWEGFPRSTIEAMRAGLPVVVSNVGGAGEAVVDGVTGYVVAPRQGEELRDRLQRLVASAQLRQEMGAAGRARYEAHLTFEHMVAQTLGVYRAVLESRASRQPVVLSR